MENSFERTYKIMLFYAALPSLFKMIYTIRIRKQLAELLILSRLDYCNCLYESLPNYLQKRLQKVQIPRQVLFAENPQELLLESLLITFLIVLNTWIIRVIRLL